MVVGANTMTNSDFLAEVYGELEPGTHGWVCSFRADPASPDPGKWAGRLYKGLPQQAALIDRATQDNTYYCTAVLTATADGEIVRRKDAFKRLAVLVLDDVQLADVAGFSYAIQTSPGKFQVGIFLDREDADTWNRQLVDRVMSALAARGRSNDASGNACTRLVRLPEGMNTKPRPAGDWRVQLEAWNPGVRWSLEDACAAVGIDLDNLRTMADTPRAAQHTSTGNHAGELVADLTKPNPGERVYHDSITRLAANLIAGGMFPGAAVEHLYSIMDAMRPDTRNAEEYRRWETRRAEIPRAVKSAEKFAPAERAAPQITVNLSAGQGEDVKDINPSASVLQPMNWEVLESTDPPPVTWALQGWLPHKHVTLLSANGGVGKSNLSLQLSVAIATGREFLGMPTQQGRVLIISAEDDAPLVHLRMRHICDDAGVALQELQDRVTVYDMTQQDCVLWRNSGPTERMQWLADVVVASKADVVIIDNASDVFAANENDRAEVRGFMRCLKTIAGATGAAILLLAHVDKASVRGTGGIDSDSTFSGSTAWNNSARSRWAMVVGKDRREITIKHEKCNVGRRQEPFSIEYDSTTHVFRRFGCIPGQQVADAVVRNAKRAAILKLLHEADKDGQKLSMSANANNNAFRALQYAEGFPTVDRKEFFTLLYEMQRESLIGEEEYTHNRKRFRRIVLTQAGLTRVAIGSGAAPTWAQREDEDDQE